VFALEQLMQLVRPSFVVLDTSTLGNLSRDYWSQSVESRDKARTFVKRTKDESIYVTVTLTQFIELLRHENEVVARERYRFLQKLPLVAWPRPYDQNWCPGHALDILTRELHAVVNGGIREWARIVEYVRKDIWQTGVGSEMFPDDESQWPALRSETQHGQRKEQRVASIVRVNLDDIRELTIAEVRRLPTNRLASTRQIVSEMTRQIERHGDRRIEQPIELAHAFANELQGDLDQIVATGGDLVQGVCTHFGVPIEIVTDNLTINHLGQLAVYVKQLAHISKQLRPQAVVDIRNVPLESMPSYVIRYRLADIQRTADRVSGSDVGDNHIASFVLYADAVEVDKRTNEYLKQIQNADPLIGALMGNFFRTADYSEIPDRFKKGAWG
jgi:hypothetical protein